MQTVTCPFFDSRVTPEVTSSADYSTYGGQGISGMPAKELLYDDANRRVITVQIASNSIGFYELGAILSNSKPFYQKGGSYATIYRNKSCNLAVWAA